MKNGLVAIFFFSVGVKTLFLLEVDIASSSKFALHSNSRKQIESGQMKIIMV